VSKSRNEELIETSVPRVCDDEIDLVQLFTILIRRKFLICGVVIICLIIGAALAFLRSPSYAYSTVIEIGSIIKNMAIGDVNSIEEPSAVLEKVKVR